MVYQGRMDNVTIVENCNDAAIADWLAARLREKGAAVDVLPFYRRLPAPGRHWPAGADTVMSTSVAGLALIHI